MHHQRAPDERPRGRDAAAAPLEPSEDGSWAAAPGGRAAAGLPASPSPAGGAAAPAPAPAEVATGAGQPGPPSGQAALLQEGSSGGNGPGASTPDPRLDMVAAACAEYHQAVACTDKWAQKAAEVAATKLEALAISPEGGCAAACLAAAKALVSTALEIAAAPAAAVDERAVINFLQLSADYCVRGAVIHRGFHCYLLALRLMHLCRGRAYGAGERADMWEELNSWHRSLGHHPTSHLAAPAAESLPEYRWPFEYLASSGASWKDWVAEQGAQSARLRTDIRLAQLWSTRNPAHSTSPSKMFDQQAQLWETPVHQRLAGADFLPPKARLLILRQQMRGAAPGGGDSGGGGNSGLAEPAVRIVEAAASRAFVQMLQETMEAAPDPQLANCLAAADWDPELGLRYLDNAPQGWFARCAKPPPGMAGPPGAAARPSTGHARRQQKAAAPSSSAAANAADIEARKRAAEAAAAALLAEEEEAAAAAAAEAASRAEKAARRKERQRAKRDAATAEQQGRRAIEAAAAAAEEQAREEQEAAAASREADRMRAEAQAPAAAAMAAAAEEEGQSWQIKAGRAAAAVQQRTTQVQQHLQQAMPSASKKAAKRARQRERRAAEQGSSGADTAAAGPAAERERAQVEQLQQEDQQQERNVPSESEQEAQQLAELMRQLGVAAGPSLAAAAAAAAPLPPAPAAPLPATLCLAAAPAAAQLAPSAQPLPAALPPAAAAGPVEGATATAVATAPAAEASTLDDPEASHFLCPITQELMADPVVCADGHTYERGAIAAWLDRERAAAAAAGRAPAFRSPMTNEPLEHAFLIPNHAMRSQIAELRSRRGGGGG